MIQHCHSPPMDVDKANEMGKVWAAAMSCHTRNDNKRRDVVGKVVSAKPIDE